MPGIKERLLKRPIEPRFPIKSLVLLCSRVSKLYYVDNVKLLIDWLGPFEKTKSIRKLDPAVASLLDNWMILAIASRVDLPTEEIIKILLDINEENFS